MKKFKSIINPFAKPAIKKLETKKTKTKPYQEYKFEPGVRKRKKI